MLLPPRTPAVDAVLRAAAALRAPIELVYPGRVSAQIVGMDDACFRIVPLAPAVASELVDSAVVRVVAHVEGRVWEFESALGHDEQGARLRLPSRLRPFQRRASARIAAPSGSTLLFGFDGKVLRRPIVDLAAGGLGVEFTGSADEPAPGTALSELRFGLPVGAAINTAGVVRHVRPREGDGVPIAGLDLIGLAEPDARRLEAWVRGNTRTRKRQAASLAAGMFAATQASLRDGRGGERSRPVVDLTLQGLTIGLQAEDRDLPEGTALPGVALWHQGQRVIDATARVSEVVAHRSHPLQARLAWERLSPEDTGRLGRLLRRLAG